MDYIVLSKDNIKSVCRTCLIGQTPEMFSILDELEYLDQNESKMISIFDVLKNIASIEVCINTRILFSNNKYNSFQADVKDNFPNLICSNCIKSLKLLLNFHQQCKRSQLILNTLLSETKIKQEQLCVKDDIEEIKNDFDYHSDIDLKENKNAEDSVDDHNVTNFGNVV